MSNKNFPESARMRGEFSPAALKLMRACMERAEESGRKGLLPGWLTGEDPVLLGTPLGGPEDEDPT